MTTQGDAAPPLIGGDVDPADSARLLRLVGLFLAPGESVLGLAAVSRSPGGLTHVAVTGRRLLGFVAADIAKVGPAVRVALTDMTSVDAPAAATGRRSLIVDAGGTRTAYGDLAERDAGMLVGLVRERLAPAPAAAPAFPPPVPAAPAPATSPPAAPAPAVPGAPASAVPGSAAPRLAAPGSAAPQPAAPTPTAPGPAMPLSAAPAPLTPATAPPAPASSMPSPGALPPLPSTFAPPVASTPATPAAYAPTPLPVTPAPAAHPPVVAAPAAPVAQAPVSWRYVSPPGWPVPPPGWTPPPGWRADPSWPAPPPDWQFWVRDVPAPVPAPVQAPPPEPSPFGATGGDRRPVFGGRKQRIEELEAENARLRAEAERLGLLEPMRLAAEIDALRMRLDETRTELRRETARLEEARTAIVETRDVALLQEVGVYEYLHPLADVVAYKAKLAAVKDEISSIAREGRAVVGATNWSVNGSQAQGRAMVRDFSKLMLRAYNAEADNLVRTMRPYKLQSALDRLDKTAQTIERLGKTMDIRVSAKYRNVRRRELRLTADHLAKAEEERERIRAERERQREEDKARREFEREKARLLKERSHVESAIVRLEARGDASGADELRAKLDDVDAALTSVAGREANTRTGHVYVISNLGAFGERMVKIGMTRRLDPMERVRELGDASVPFHFDVHALIFSADAVELENRLHQEFAERRVNRVNNRREFFYATPGEVRDVLARIADNHLVEYKDVPEAEEYRRSSG
ncbi:T5orf172 domain protein [Actinomadura rubteroloni]|uniref:T5orf172 domain protein n=1 Tax=Actinomadura rubteroloni TaxID=1926885 RepID=A0A2P4UE98_9ACTN|nr:DUF4041 domain-containing protein [Actinomadura rubteroloni]POM23394.1 T5orf172 domain protein [Actinomadura rubteroloni]